MHFPLTEIRNVNIHQALSDIAEIRAQLDRTESYRGFRSTAVGISALMVLAGCWVQYVSVAHPALQVDRYLWIWFVVAISSICIAAVEMLVRSRISKNKLVNRIHWSLVSQMSPCLLVGFLLTLLISDHAIQQDLGEPNLMWALPGLWSMTYSLGLFACLRQFPSDAKWIAWYFLAAGGLLLFLNWQTRIPAGWQMFASFGVGQMMLSFILYWNVERCCGQE